MIRLFFAGGSDARTVESVRAKLPKILDALEVKMNELHARLQQKIQTEKLSGQVLHHRTGKLINSIRMIPAETTGAQLVGYVEGAGGPAWYGRLHETGTGNSYEIVPVGKKALAFLVQGKQVIVRRVRHGPIQERSFMRTSLEEMQPTIVSEMQEAVARAIEETS